MNVKEIKALRLKFIIIAMISFFLVMAFIGTVINITSHMVTINSIKSTLANIRINHGNIIDMPDFGDDGVPFTPSFSDAFAPKYRHNHYFYMVNKIFFCFTIVPW